MRAAGLWEPVPAGRCRGDGGKTMKRRDLHATIVIAAGWLLGIMMYSIWKGPTLLGEEGGIHNALQPLPIAAQIFADEHAPKHSKLPMRWAHQRWGAV